MKKLSIFLTTILLAAISAFGFAACNDDNGNTSSDGSGEETPVISDPDKETPDVPNSSDGDTTDTDGNNDVLVVYFSWSSSGNTEKMANHIAAQTGATVWEITPVTPYPTQYTPTTEVAREEKENNARPAINNPLDAQTVAKYSSVFVGFPIWWHTAPMIIGTFLESYEWSSDINIYPFFQGASNNNDSYYTETLEFINSCADGATVHGGLYAASSNTSAIDNYLRDNGFIK